MLVLLLFLQSDTSTVMIKNEIKACFIKSHVTLENIKSKYWLMIKAGG